MGWSIFKEGGGDAAARSWAQQFLSKLSVPVTPGNIDFILKWEQRAAGSGKYNPLGVGSVTGHPELTTGSTKRLKLGAVKDYVQGYADQLATMFGIKSAGGYREHDDFSDHPSGHAVDFMITDIGKGGKANVNPDGKSVGDRLSSYAVANYKALGIKYVIWNHNVWTAAKGWHPYTQAGQGPHDDHVHITWNDSPGTSPPLNAADYTSWESGLQGAVFALQQTQFAGVLAALQNNDPDAADKALGSAGTSVSTVANTTNVADVPDAQCAWKLKTSFGTTCVVSKTQMRHILGGGLIVSSVIVGLAGVVILMVYGMSDQAVSAIPGARSITRAVGKAL